MPFTRTVNGDLYPRDLSNAYQGPRIYDPGWALSKDPEADDKLLRDTVIAALVRQRKHKVAPLKWRMEPGDDTPAAKKYAKTIEGMLKRIDGFAEARFNLADAELKSRAYAFIRGQYQPDNFGDGFTRLWWVPRQLVDMDRRRFRRVVECRKPLRTAWELWDVENRKWCRITAPEVFVKHVYDDDESNLGYGRGLMDSLYLYWRAKSVVLEEGLAGVERWARGALIAKIDGLRESVTGKTNAVVAQEFLDTLDKMRGRHAMAFDKQDEVEPLTGGMEGHQMVQDFLRYLDGAVERLLLGKQSLDSDSGSLARAGVEQDEGDASMAFSREHLDETIQRDLVGLCIDVNRDVLNTMGFSHVEPPRFTSAPVVKPKPDVAATTAKTLLDAGVRLVAKDVYEQTGFKQPLPGDDVIEPRPQQAPTPFGAGGFGPPPGGMQTTDAGGDKPPPPAPRPDAPPPRTSGFDDNEPFAADFRESEHPRKTDGEFKEKGEADGTSEKPQGRATMKIEEIIPDPSKPRLPTRFGTDGNPIEGSIAGIDVTTLERGVIGKMSKRTKAMMEDVFSDPEVVSEFHKSGMHTIRVQKSSDGRSPTGWTAAHSSGTLIIHPRTADVLASSKIPERREYGLRRVIFHESGHARWDKIDPDLRTEFSRAVAAHPEVEQTMGAIVNLRGDRDSEWGTSAADVKMSEIHAETYAMSKYAPERFASLPEPVRAAFTKIHANAPTAERGGMDHLRKFMRPQYATPTPPKE